MAGFQLHTLLEGGAFFESPRWHEGRWWVSDFYRHLVLSVGTDGEPREVLEVEGQPSGLGWMPDGSMLVVSMRDHRILRWSEEEGVSEHADVSGFCGGHLNDMVVDMHGRAYAGNFGFDLMGGADPALANLVRVDPDGSASVAAEGLLFPNGSVITPDGRTLIVGETAGARYTSFTIADDGSLVDRRVWAQLAPTPEVTTLAETLGNLQFGPDGCGLDAENHIWCADEVGARCVRIAPGGAIVEEIPAPEGLDFFACMLGGEDGRTLLICAAPDFAEANRAAVREAVLLTSTVEVPHAGLP
ncbi:MAG TPA: SMP-30/gluconolactonase/LRE family protein [Solirubrobacteraceae bacterium]|nr:SMP-30/gluconolactonase/LRE family protein [Solirubrobacteraceae bacterium]